MVRARNLFRVQNTFDNLAQYTEEYWTDVSNLKNTPYKLTDQVTLYTNHLSTKENDSMSLHWLVQNLPVKFKNLKANIYHLENHQQYLG